MSSHVYKTIEVTGSSPEGVDQAMKRGVDFASKSVKNMRWVEVTSIRGHLEDNKIAHWQVTMKIGFTLEGS